MTALDLTALFAKTSLGLLVWLTAATIWWSGFSVIPRRSVRQSAKPRRRRRTRLNHNIILYISIIWSASVASFNGKLFLGNILNISRIANARLNFHGGRVFIENFSTLFVYHHDHILIWWWGVLDFGKHNLKIGSGTHKHSTRFQNLQYKKLSLEQKKLFATNISLTFLEILFKSNLRANMTSCLNKILLTIPSLLEINHTWQQGIPSTSTGWDSHKLWLSKLCMADVP